MKKVKRHQKNLKGKRGITLIALVITIIVLLILAGVTIATLTGENGILTRAQESKEKTEEETLKENVQIDILDAQAKNNGQITTATLIGILEKYFKNVPDSLSDNFSEILLESKEEYGNFTIKLSDIWEGELKNTSLADKIIPANYGDYINYNIDLNNNGIFTDDWRIFYNDGTNIFIIASDYVLNSMIPEELTCTVTDKEHSVSWDPNVLPNKEKIRISQDVASKFLFSWNSKYPDSTNSNAKVVGELLNTEIWKDFAKGLDGAKAVGGPTLEMLIASWNQKGNAKLYCDNYDDIGYYLGNSTKPTSFAGKLEGDNSNLYSIPAKEDVNAYWIASPTYTGRDHLASIFTSGTLYYQYYRN